MAKFTFKLDSMKRYRENRVLVAKKELFILEGKLSDLKESLQRAFQERSDEIENSLKKLELFSAAQLHSQLALIQNQKMRIIEEEIKVAEEDADRQRRWLAQLGQELKVVEKLEEKQRHVFDEEQKLKEKRVLDQWVAERWKGGDA